MGNESKLLQRTTGQFQTNFPKTLAGALGIPRDARLSWTKTDDGALVRAHPPGSTLEAEKYTSTLHELKHGQRVTIVPKPFVHEMAWQDGDKLEWILTDGELHVRKKEE